MSKCKTCDEEIVQTYMPMKEWNIEGPLCGRCYSIKISEYYPGDHVRMGIDEKD